MSKLLDDLRAAAEAEFAATRAAGVVEPQVQPEPATEPVQTEPTTEQVPAPTAESAEPVVVTEPDNKGRRVVYTKTVDLGDGSPPQVFKAATKDELIDKIWNAQVNASKRIKELKAQNKELQNKITPDPAQPTRNYESRQLTPEEELEIANELQSNPSSGIAKAIKAALGADLSEVRDVMAELRNLKDRESIREIGQKFVDAHPEYPISSTNEKLMAQYIQKNNLAWTLKNLELAFSDLVEAGLIVLPVSKPVEEPIRTVVLTEDDEPVVVTAPKPAEQVAPARTDTGLVEVPRRKKAVVGISSNQTVATVESEEQHEASVSDFLKLSPAERRRIVMNQYGR